MNASSQPLLRVDGVVKTYESTAGPVHAVQDVSFELQRGAFAALVGPSGCGKTTLLNAIGGLDRVTSGRIWIDGTEVTALSDRETIEFRLRRIGFVFQAYNLVPVLNAWENVAFVMELQGVGVSERRNRAFELLAAVGLTGKELQRPSQLSGGQQ
ncbi:MAG: ABC transporter ATP-binding protein, partial [Schleiferiaceae bacterium]